MACLPAARVDQVAISRFTSEESTGMLKAAFESLVSRLNAIAPVRDDLAIIETGRAPGLYIGIGDVNAPLDKLELTTERGR